MHISYHYVLPESYNYEIADYVTKLFLLSLRVVLWQSVQELINPGCLV